MAQRSPWTRTKKTEETKEERTKKARTKKTRTKKTKAKDAILYECMMTGCNAMYSGDSDNWFPYLTERGRTRWFCKACAGLSDSGDFGSPSCCSGDDGPD